ncbi:MAG: lipoyl synthase [Acidobacteriota bacterium]
MSDLVPLEIPARRSGPARPVTDDGVRQRLPPWLRVRLPGGEGYRELKSLTAELSLHTVCEEASCPNVGECWSARELTIMILGDTCTRSCGFCDVKTGRPKPADAGEPSRAAEALSRLDLQHAVVTSVDRDELPDLGAGHWAETIRLIKERCGGMTLEVLVPDFQGRPELIDLVLAARPDVFAHNVETVARLCKQVRPQARSERSLAVLAQAAGHGLLTKTGVMLGLGETREELTELFTALGEAQVDILTLGQYLRPSRRHLPVERFVPPEEFDELADEARGLGLRHVEAGPLVRSSYRAGRQARQLRPRPVADAE